MCQSNYGVPDDRNAEVVCRELGYEGAATTSKRLRDYYGPHSHVLWTDLYCIGNESSVYECGRCCGQFYEGYDTCLFVPEYACQSKFKISTEVTMHACMAIMVLM